MLIIYGPTKRNVVADTVSRKITVEISEEYIDIDNVSSCMSFNYLTDSMLA